MHLGWDAGVTWVLAAPSLQLRACLRFWASVALLSPMFSTRPSAETRLLAASSCRCPPRISPGVCCCCCWGSATGCRLPASARQTSSPDASKAVSAEIRAAGLWVPECRRRHVRRRGAAGSPPRRCRQSAARQLPRPAALAPLPRRHPPHRWSEGNKAACALVRRTDGRSGGREGRGRRVTFSVLYLLSCP